VCREDDVREVRGLAELILPSQRDAEERTGGFVLDTAPLAAISLPIYTALSGQGSYFAADMDPEAFPSLDASKALTAVRGVLRTLLGHRLKKS
jgi:hypothetical protein